MPHITTRKNRRLFIEQNILNNLPLDMKARWFRYSVASQLIHPFGAAIHELSAAQERMWHNYFPSTYDVKDLDVIYHVPTFFLKTEIEAYIDDTTTVPITKTEADLDSFWYDPLPTRLQKIRTVEKQIYPTRQAKELRFGSLYSEYIAGTHLEGNLFDIASPTPWSVTSGVATVSHATQGGWGSGPSLDTLYTDLPTVSTVIEATSTSSSTGLDISFYGQSKTTGTDITSMIVTVGYQGIGSAQGTFYPDRQWSQGHVVYSPPSVATVGIPYVSIEAIKNASATDRLQLSDYHLFEYGSIHSDTAIAYPLRDWADQDLSWAYVIVSGGTNLMDVDTSVSRPPLPSSVTVEGIDENGLFATERVLIPYNGTHRTLKLWQEITGTKVDSIYPWEAEVSVQLQDYQSTSGQQDPIDSYISPYHNAPLFYSLTSTNGSSFLGHDSFIVDDFTLMVDGYDFILPRYYMELTNSLGGSHPLVDIKLDAVNRHLYALDSINKQIAIYDPFGHWPEQEAFKLMKDNSSPYPDMTIRELEEDEYILQKNGEVGLEANWRNRYKTLIKNRWTLHKPDGNMVGLDKDGNEVSASSDYWITNEETVDDLTGEFRFLPQNVKYTASQNGDFVAVLESEYTDNEQTKLTREKDATIFSVVHRTPMKVLTIPTTEARSPVGMDLDSSGNIRIAYTHPGNSSLLDEEVFSLHYDYFFEEVEGKRIYLREKYTKIKVRRSIALANSHVRVVTVVPDVDTILTVSDLDHGFIMVLSTTQPILVVLPSMTAGEDGLNFIIKRRGAFPVTIAAGAGKTIELAASQVLSIDGDANNYTYINSLNDLVKT